MVTSPPRINPTYTLVPYTTAVRFGVAFAVASGFVERMLCGGLLGISLLHICMRLFDHGGRGFCGRRGADGHHGCGLDRDRCAGDDVLELGLGLCLLLSAEHTSELPSLMRISYAVFCLRNTKRANRIRQKNTTHQNRH